MKKLNRILIGGALLLAMLNGGCGSRQATNTAGSSTASPSSDPVTGIIGAMSVEIEGLRSELTDRTDEQIGRVLYSKGKLENTTVVVAVCGWGLVNAASCTSTMILQYHPTEIINIGVAGGLRSDSGMQIGDIVVADGTVQHDLDATPLGYAPGTVLGQEEAESYCDKGIADRLYQCAKDNVTTQNVYRGIVASGNGFVSSQETSARIVKEFDALAVEMEGGAVGATCTSYNVPFGVLRTMSDNADGTAPENYNEFCESAARTSILIIREYLLS